MLGTFSDLVLLYDQSDYDCHHTAHHLGMWMYGYTTNLEKAFYAVGTEIEVASNLRFAFGFSGNSTYGFSLPMGITLARFFKIMEVSVATNDILTYFSHGSNPNISLSVCLFRINVPKKKK